MATGLLLASPALGADPAAAITTAADPVLEALIAETLLRSPDLAAAKEQAKADVQRAPQAGAMPDPTLSLSYQNDGFTSIEYGKMETSWASIMVSQPLPWPGKRGLREQVADSEARQSEARLGRTRLSLEAEVRRGYIDLLLARDQLVLLADAEGLWQQAEGLAKIRYEVGEGTQADLLRAQLERTRLVQRRWTLEADERATLASLNRLRVHPLDEPIATSVRLAELGDPPVPAVEAALADGLARSPELAEAAIAIERSTGQVALARRDRYPDLGVSAGVMPRGALMPMWQVGLSVTLPLYGRQGKALAEADLRQQADEKALDGVRQLLALRTRERLNALSALVQVNKLYREALLVLSRSATSSAMSQYGVGRTPFAAVLEVLNGYVNDQASYLESLAQAQRTAISQAELSLEATPGVGMGVGGGSVPGAGGGMGKAGGGAKKAAPAGSAKPPSSGGGMSGGGM
ncbi:MAG: TolC family protein [Myxococcaceae bacterium]